MKFNTSQVEDIARQAGELILKHFNSGTRISVNRKSDRSPVTEADIESQAFLDNALSQLAPEIPVLGEELTQEEIEKRTSGQKLDTYWIVDPLDGTHNFASGIDLFCVSVCLVHNERPVAGIIYDPVRKEMFSARAGEGSFLNGRRITTSGIKDYSDYFFFVQMRRLNPKIRTFVSEFLADAVFRIREIGSTALKLAWIACGRADANIQDRVNYWDSSAGILIVQEAEGICSDFQGNPITIAPYGKHELWAASNDHLHKWIMKGLNDFLG